MPSLPGNRGIKAMHYPFFYVCEGSMGLVLILRAIWKYRTKMGWERESRFCIFTCISIITYSAWVSVCILPVFVYVWNIFCLGALET